MCHPFFGYSQGGPHKIREILAKASVSEVEDEYGFKYVLVTKEGENIVEVVSRMRGHNETKLKLLHTSPKKGSSKYDMGLHHKDDSWKKRIAGKLYFVVMERDWSRPQMGIEVIPVRPETKTLVFEGTLYEARAEQKHHHDKLDAGPCYPVFPYGYHYEWNETSISSFSEEETRNR